MNRARYIVTATTYLISSWVPIQVSFPPIMREGFLTVTGLLPRGTK